MGEQSDQNAGRTRGRVPFQTSVTLESAEPVTYRRTHDISMNGLFVSTAKPLPMGTRAPFRMEVGVGMRKETIKGLCEVVRIVSIDDGLSDEEPGPGMGLKFVEIEPDSSELLYRIIRYNQPAS